MKSTNQIANECNIGYYQVREIIKKEGIVPSHKVGKRNFYNKYQENYIIEIRSMAYCVGRAMFEIVESSMNKEKFKGQKQIEFEEFKQRTYGNQNNRS